MELEVLGRVLFPSTGSGLATRNELGRRIARQGDRPVRGEKLGVVPESFGFQSDHGQGGMWVECH